MSKLFKKVMIRVDIKDPSSCTHHVWIDGKYTEIGKYWYFEIGDRTFRYAEPLINKYNKYSIFDVQEIDTVPKQSSEEELRLKRNQIEDQQTYIIKLEEKIKALEKCILNQFDLTETIENIKKEGKIG